MLSELFYTVCEFRTSRRLNSNLLHLSLDHRANSEDPGFTTTAFVITTSLVNCYDLNAPLRTFICSRNNNPTLQVNDKIREISAAFTCGLVGFRRPPNRAYYPLSYGVPVRERYGSTLLPATREQHDQNCTQSH